MTKRLFFVGALAIGIALLLTLSTAVPQAQNGGAVRIDNDDIGGVVTSSKGPEAGVWVIAETTNLPTRLIKSVVTDDRGRYLIPDLPKASYSVWVRGYGLVDSQKVQAEPGKIANLTAVLAPSARAAAEYYPANYWYAMINIPPKSDFPGTGAKGNGISETLKTQAEWINHMKSTSCTPCHSLGNKATREIPKSLGVFDSGAAAWDRRVQSGLAGNMNAYPNRFGRQRLMAMYGDWTDRIAAGELPQDVPPRPQGLERNVVITQWDWAGDREYFHDLIASDKRNPSVNANGPVFGVTENASDFVHVVDPTNNTTKSVLTPTLDPKLQAGMEKVVAPSPYWGDEVYWDSKVITHSNTLDQKGRMWGTSRIRAANANPEFCKEGSSHPSAKLFPLNTSGRQYSVYDPKADKWSFVNTCFGTFHLNFAHDADNTIWTGSGGVVGWVNTRILDETGDQEKAQGWAPLVLDTNGNGKQDAWVNPDDPVDPTKDKRINVSFYGVSVSPADGSVWGTLNDFPGAVVRVAPGPNPPTTTLAEIYVPPYPEKPGYNPRGMDVDANGVFWAVMQSGHLGSFDRRKCKGPLNGPQATGQHCPEGWDFYQVPGPNFKGNPETSSADANYYAWVDKYDTLGLGKNIPMATGNLSESMLALVNGKFVTIRVPYPMGFFNKQMDGRIDDPKAGWKGKGLWTTYATRLNWHLEGGKGTKGKAVKVQIRPNPLAK